MLSELEQTPGAILFIDEIHTVIGAGATSGGAMDASNLLKPALAGGVIRCIGSTTYKEYRNYFEKDRALVRRFQKIDVNEPTIEDLIKILRGLNALLRAAPQGALHDRRDPRRGRAVASLYRRPASCPRHEGWCAIDVIDEIGCGADAAARKQAQEDDHRQGGRGLHRDDGAHPAKERAIARRPRGAEKPDPRPGDEWCSARTRRSRQGAGLGDQAGPRRPARPRKADSVRTCSRARPASARPRSRASLPARLALRSPASTCRNTWSGTPFRG